MTIGALGTITATIGLPGSGKSYWAKKQVRRINGAGGKACRVGRDGFRDTLFDFQWTPRAAEAGLLPKWQEDAVTAAQFEVIRRMVRMGLHVFVDDTNIRPGYLTQLEHLAAGLGTTLRTQDFRYVPLNVCIAQDAARERRGEPAVGEDVIRYLHQTYIVGAANEVTA